MNQLFFVQPEKRVLSSYLPFKMDTVVEYVDRKNELEERIQSLENEKTSLLSDISSLKERLVNLELERHVSSLSNEVEALRTERTVLEEKISTFAVESSAASSEGYQI